MKRILFILSCLLLLTLTGCSSTNTILYKGVLENITTVKKTTTLTFADNIAITTNYNPDFNKEGAIIFGETYELMDYHTWAEDQVYLQKANP